MPDYMIRTTDYLDAQIRREQARAAHLAAIEKAKTEGVLFMGAAVLDEKGKPTGSLICGRFESRDAVASWLEQEPYYTQKVWEKIEILELRLGPSFVKDSAP